MHLKTYPPERNLFRLYDDSRYISKGCVCVRTYIHILALIWPFEQIQQAMICICIKYIPYLKGALLRKYLGCMYFYTFPAAAALAVGAVAVAVFFGSGQSVPCPPGRAGGAEPRWRRSPWQGGRAPGPHVTPCPAYRCVNLFGGQQQPTKQTGREKQPANQTSADALKWKVLKSSSFALSACWSPVAHAGVPKKAPLPGESIH